MELAFSLIHKSIHICVLLQKGLTWLLPEKLQMQDSKIGQEAGFVILRHFIDL
ncbi:unnamed protein product [Arabidopsis thaliana]|uniref:Uncharacterized protein n=1 Tax=Arabidopsis thaliana TaxID=3702 RepID=A0A5S9WXF5_ARATH|nr:unnamed protein product [Arabidopsis thaliana]